MIDSKFQDQVLVSCQSNTDWKEYFDLIIKSVNHTKKYEKIDKSYRIDVYLVGNSEIKDLNSKFLNNNYETDVLSFNFYEGWKDGALEKSESLFPGEKSEEGIGEIYISIPKIKSQAKENSISFAKELSTMAIHGALHLLGYNHEEILEEKIMFSKTEKILNKVISE